MWFRRRREPEAPQGVRIRHGDGTVTDCAVVLDPERARGGMTQWFAEPPAGTVFTPGADTITVDLMPPRTTVNMVVRLKI
jgi:hypothetical protein